ncbi:hypothetical protein ASE74_13770 [Pedobacter sp. Leaf216]|uniref:hypothetical protein n=1 Tax=Pedobacter sp. Leaf216 TaxID=1735684 RepID=UPI0006FBEA04|nr:hypothetical protein [Pedobacter sp. Leaf216]KQM78564.1 hypothetical protein ASE74_13770 [Pedobacter sp. Leaf216]
MKRPLVILTFIALIMVLACKKHDETLQNATQVGLDNLYNDIQKMANQYSCQNAGEWKFIAIGSKPCGGASGYIAYSVKIDESSFLKKVEQFTQLQAEYNKKNGMYSDCSLVIQPKSVICENGKPKFTY